MDWEDPSDARTEADWTNAITIKGRIDVYAITVCLRDPTRSGSINTVECSPYLESPGLMAIGTKNSGCH